MTPIEVSKFYIRHTLDRIPETANMYAALQGFEQLGVETARYYPENVGNLDKFEDLGLTVGLAGFIKDVWEALWCCGRMEPKPLDYPTELECHLCRSVSQTTLGEVRAARNTLFVKPVEHKLFTGFVWKGRHDEGSRRRIVTHGDDVRVWVSPFLDMVSEYRAFILRGEILDVRRYKGDWSFAPDKKIVEGAVKAMGNKVVAYAIDFAVLRDGRTVVVEANDGFALGHYGLEATYYARMLSARWYEMVTVLGSTR